MQNQDRPAAVRARGAAEGPSPAPAEPREADPTAPGLATGDGGAELQGWLDALPEALAVLDLAGRLHRCNAAFLDLVRARRDADLRTPAATEAWRAVLRDLPRPPRPPQDEVVLPDGRRVVRLVQPLAMDVPRLVLLVREVPVTAG